MMPPNDAAQAPVLGPGAPARSRFRAYLILTKPRILELLLVTTVPVMLLAQRGLPSLLLMVCVVIGGSLSAGSAGAFNMYLDRDIDARMERTAGRPLVTGEISPAAGLRFAWILGLASVLWLGVTVNWAAAALATGGLVYYVVVYTMLLKRRTEQNIVWGGIAGCAPVLVAWAAVTGTVGWPALVLALVVFLWTPAHYWPLSMAYGGDYRRADVPMMGAIRAPMVVVRRVVLYAWLTVLSSLLLIPLAQTSVLYGVTAVAAGAWFCLSAHRLLRRVRRGEPGNPMHVFRVSISYLALLFVAVGIDPFLPI